MIDDWRCLSNILNFRNKITTRPGTDCYKVVSCTEIISLGKQFYWPSILAYRKLSFINADVTLETMNPKNEHNNSWISICLYAIIIQFRIHVLLSPHYIYYYVHRWVAPKFFPSRMFGRKMKMEIYCDIFFFRLVKLTHPYKANIETKHRTEGNSTVQNAMWRWNNEWLWEITRTAGLKSQFHREGRGQRATGKVFNSKVRFTSNEPHPQATRSWNVALWWTPEAFRSTCKFYFQLNLLCQWTCTK